jgi:hypothetical protein
MIRGDKRRAQISLLVTATLWNLGPCRLITNHDTAGDTAVGDRGIATSQDADEQRAVRFPHPCSLLMVAQPIPAWNPTASAARFLGMGRMESSLQAWRPSAGVGHPPEIPLLWIR